MAQDFIASNLNRYIVVDTENGCWIWTGRLFKGVPISNIRRSDGTYRQIGIHTYMWEMTHPNITRSPHNCVIHACRNRLCCNPKHLQLRTRKDMALTSRRTHCQRGHEFTSENTGYQKNGVTRYCKACKNMTTKRWLDQRQF